MSLLWRSSPTGLPVNYAGVALIVFGLGLLVLEVR
jgi:membrane-bound ClpP family serine protease